MKNEKKKKKKDKKEVGEEGKDEGAAHTGTKLKRVLWKSQKCILIGKYSTQKIKN